MPSTHSSLHVGVVGLTGFVAVRIVDRINEGAVWLENVGAISYGVVRITGDVAVDFESGK